MSTTWSNGIPKTVLLVALHLLPAVVVADTNVPERIISAEVSAAATPTLTTPSQEGVKDVTQVPSPQTPPLKNLTPGVFYGAATGIPPDEKKYQSATTTQTVKSTPQNTAQLAKTIEPVKSPEADIAKNSPPSVSSNNSLNPSDYIESEKLEKLALDTDGKKRFYSVPDALGKTQTINSADVVKPNKLAKNDNGSAYRAVAANYTHIAADKAAAMLGQSCFPQQTLKKAKVLGLTPMGIWPVKKFTEELNAQFVRLDQNMKELQLVSYTKTDVNPAYYWPLVVYLNDDGCVVEGVTHFYLSTLPATQVFHSALLGNLLVPPKSRYIMLTPLQQSPDMAHVKLIESGEVQLVVIHAND